MFGSSLPQRGQSWGSPGDCILQSGHALEAGLVEWFGGGAGLVDTVCACELIGCPVGQNPLDTSVGAPHEGHVVSEVSCAVGVVDLLMFRLPVF